MEEQLMISAPPKMGEIRDHDGLGTLGRSWLLFGDRPYLESILAKIHLPAGLKCLSVGDQRLFSGRFPDGSVMTGWEVLFYSKDREQLETFDIVKAMQEVSDSEPPSWMMEAARKIVHTDGINTEEAARIIADACREIGGLRGR